MLIEQKGKGVRLRPELSSLSGRKTTCSASAASGSGVSLKHRTRGGQTRRGQDTAGKPETRLRARPESSLAKGAKKALELGSSPGLPAGRNDRKAVGNVRRGRTVKTPKNPNNQRDKLAEGGPDQSGTVGPLRANGEWASGRSPFQGSLTGPPVNGLFEGSVGLLVPLVSPRWGSQLGPKQCGVLFSGRY